jgi:hypothetical protein
MPNPCNKYIFGALAAAFFNLRSIDAGELSLGVFAHAFYRPFLGFFDFLVYVIFSISYTTKKTHGFAVFALKNPWFYPWFIAYF